jgi:hypothetical protein
MSGNRFRASPFTYSDRVVKPMDEKRLDSVIDQVSDNLFYVIREVGKRGISENDVDADDFHALLSRKEFQDLVVGELYEAYFLPERHESDWQLLRELVTILTSERIKEFVALSVAGGVIGNTASAVLLSIVGRIISAMKKAKLPPSKWRPFYGMRDDIDGLEHFFRENECARIVDLESSTGIPRERLYPLLKLLGFTHYRRQHACYWCRPGHAPLGHRYTGI